MAVSNFDGCICNGVVINSPKPISSSLDTSHRIIYYINHIHNMKVFTATSAAIVVAAAITSLPSASAKLQFGRRVVSNNNDDSSDDAAPIQVMSMPTSTTEDVGHVEEDDIPQINPTKYIGLDLREAVEALIVHSEREFIPKFLRLGFHDCVGGCDGCVDMNNPDNAGLLEAIEHLATLYNTFKVCMYTVVSCYGFYTISTSIRVLLIVGDSPFI